MLETIVILILFIALVAAGGRRVRAEHPPTIQLGDYADLPCPWCRAPTRESDDYCTGCGQTFGSVQPRDSRHGWDPR